MWITQVIDGAFTMSHLTPVSDTITATGLDVEEERSPDFTPNSFSSSFSLSLCCLSDLRDLLFKLRR